MIEIASISDGLPDGLSVYTKHWSKRPQTPGLFKIHGTTQAFDGSKFFPDDEVTPSATLASIARSRHDTKREAFLHDLLADRALVVVGYSAGDDFDLCVWLQKHPCPLGIYWIAYNGPEPGLRRLLEKRHAGLGPIMVLDLIGRDGRPEIIERIFLELAHEVVPAKWNSLPALKASFDWKAVVDRWLSSRVQSPWQRNILCAELLKHVSQFHESAALLQSSLADLDPARYPDQAAITRMLLSEALSDTGSKADRMRALDEARSALAFFSATKRAQSHLNGARIAFAKATRTAPKRSFEDSYNQLTQVLQDSSASELEIGRAHIELDRLRRLWKEFPRDVPVNKVGSQDLYVEALAKHETGKRAWVDAKSPDELREVACIPLQDAATLRELLGDTDGLCATTNVLGQVHIQLADWFDCIGDSDRKEWAAVEAHKHVRFSMAVADSHKLEFHRYSARITSVLLGISHEVRGMSLSNVRGDLFIASQFDAAQPLERYRLQYLQILFDVALSGHAADAAKAARSSFEELANEIERSGQAGGARKEEQYVAMRARLNALACRCLGGDSRVDSLMGASETLIVQARSAYWSLMTDRLVKFVVAGGGTSIARRLLPPLPIMG